MSSRLGRSSGFLASMLAMRCLAGASSEDGIVYRASRIHRYVSFRFVVSNGGRPNSIVYITQPRAQMSDSQPCPCLFRTSGER